MRVPWACFLTAFPAYRCGAVRLGPQAAASAKYSSALLKLSTSSRCLRHAFPAPMRGSGSSGDSLAASAYAPSASIYSLRFVGMSTSSRARSYRSLALHMATPAPALDLLPPHLPAAS